MIIKKREIPLQILKLLALLQRIPSHHQKFPLIQEDLAKYSAGFKGELSIDYPLSFLSEEKYFIFHVLRLKDNQNHHFQIDSLLLSKNFSFAYGCQKYGRYLVL